MKLSTALWAPVVLIAASLSCSETAGPEAEPGDPPQHYIAFYGDGLSMIREDSSHIRTLVQGEARWPRWTPDGGSIIFVEPVFWRIKACDTRTGSTRTLIDLGGGVNNITSLHLSPNGQKALFAVDGSIGGVLYTVEVTTGDTLSLRRGGDRPTFAWIRQAQWSATGDRIAFLADSRAWTIDSSGGDLRPLTDSSEQCTDLAWSPTGDRLAVTTALPGMFSEVYTLSSSGADRINISRHPKRDEEARWSPDGTRLAFISMRSDTSSLVVCDLNGDQLRIISRSPEEQQQYAWSPTSERIVFSKYVAGAGQQLMMVSVEDPKPRLLTRATNGTWWPAWSPVKL